MAVALERFAEISTALPLDVYENLHVNIIYAFVRHMLQYVLTDPNSITKVLNIYVHTYMMFILYVHTYVNYHMELSSDQSLHLLNFMYSCTQCITIRLW